MNLFLISEKSEERKRETSRGSEPPPPGEEVPPPVSQEPKEKEGSVQGTPREATRGDSKTKDIPKNDERKGSKERSRHRDSSRSPRRRRTRSRSRSGSAKRNRKRSPSPKPKKVHVSRLTRNVLKGHVQEIFANFGTVKSVDMVMDRNRSWISRGDAYVEFEDPKDCEEAIKHMNKGKSNWFFF